MKRNIKLVTIFLFVISFFVISNNAFAAATYSIPSVGINVGNATNAKEASTSIQILILLTVLSIVPSIIILTTSFTRIIMVLSFLRNALGTQQMPPNQVLAGLALFLTLFIMQPVINDVYTNAYQPFSKGSITQEVAFDRASTTMKTFMLKQTHKDDLQLFVNMSNTKPPATMEEAKQLSLTVVMPAFLISELTTAFKIGFLIFIPFLVIDMVVSSTLMSMGMMMLPPVMISLPFKILLFIMVGGWNLIAKTLVNSFIR